jgi:hypothetical protein
LKYIKLYENFFEDMERAADQAHKPVPFKKKEKPVEPEQDTEIEEEPTELKKPVETATNTEEDTVETTTEAPKTEEPKTFKDWLAAKVAKVVECDETSESTGCWVELENGTSCQWSISMEDYPTVEASFKLGSDTVYLDDVTSGKIAREYYTKQREYDPKPWAECVLKVGAEFPDFMRRMEKEAINRATDQDRELSKIISAEFGNTEKTNESLIELMKMGLIDPEDLQLVTLHTEHQSKGSNPHYGLSPAEWFKLKQSAAGLGIFHSSGFATGEVYGISWTGPSNSFTKFKKMLSALPNPPFKEWFSSHKSKSYGELYRNEVEQYKNRQ